MKRLLLLILCILIAVPTLAAAKTVLYVSSQSCGGLGCDCLGKEDKLFCARMKDMGYDVILDWENDVKDNTDQWRADYAKADLIFLGDVSKKMYDKTQSQALFCNGVKNAGKNVFATFGNTYKNRTYYGCAFELLLASYPSDAEENLCSTNNLKITESNYITRGFPLNEVTQVYADAEPVRIHYGTTPAASHCAPDGLSTGDYTVINVDKDKGTFWGLIVPSKLTANGWLLFERTLLYTTGDSNWNISYFTVPEKVSAGKTFMLLAQIKRLTKPVTSATVNVAFDGAAVGSLTFNNASGYWENKALRTADTTEMEIAGDEGSLKEQLTAGGLDVRITSGAYSPNAPYSIKAAVYSGDTAVPADVTYKIRDSKLKVLFEGEMNQVSGSYYADVDLSGTSDLILEVSAASEAATGGLFKVIRPQNASTLNYTITPAEWIVSSTKPGSSSMTFTLTSGNEITGLRLDKSGELADAIMINSTHMGQVLQAGKTTQFSAKLDWTHLDTGEKSGEIFLDSEQFSASIPVKFYYYNLPGNWLESEQKITKVAAPAGRTVTQKITLKNTATIPTTGIAVSSSDGLKGLVSLKDEPYYIAAGAKKDITLVFDATKKKEGRYSGTITITSSLGKAEVYVDFDVTADISTLLNSLESEYHGELVRLTEGGVQLTSEAADVSSLINSTMESAKSALAAGDYTSANQAYNTARENLDELKTMKKAEGTNWLVILLVLVALGVFGYAGWAYYKKKQAEKPEKKKELPKAEDQYRTEYY